MAKSLDHFESPKRRLRRAKANINRLEKRIGKFMAKGPGGLVTETDAEGWTVHAFKFTRKFPDSWADTSAEIIEALRSCLDQAGYAAASLGGVTAPTKSYFPIADTPADLDGIAAKNCKHLPPEIQTLFRGFDAHEGGDYALWALNKLANANKHRLLMPVAGLVGGTMLNFGHIERPPVDLFMPRWDRDKNQIAIARVGPGGAFHYDAEVSFFVAIDDFNGVKSAPAVGAFNAIADKVERVLLATEAECKRIGILK